MAKSKVRINYKNGRSITIKCDTFKVERVPLTGAVSVSWTGAKPTPLLIGIDEIESIWEL